MTPEVYRQLAQQTECDQTNAMVRIYTHNASRFLHSIIGMSAELGEIASLAQKMLYYGTATKTEVVQKLVYEYGDLLWYVDQSLRCWGFTLEDVLELNIRKLQKRYPDKQWNPEHCINRNTTKEETPEHDHTDNKLPGPDPDLQAS